MDRYDLQRLARMRLREAEVLLRNGCFQGAYYVAGYVVEFALKACIARSTRRFQFPERSFAQAVHTHELGRLLLLARLDAPLRNATDEVRQNWKIVAGWASNARYDLVVSGRDAADYLRAVSARKHGVLAWLRQHW